jgi:thiol-disulfide isomerase/thioredoxin
LPISVGPFALSPERLLFLIAFMMALLVGWIAGRRNRVAVEPVLTQMLLLGMLSARLAFVLLYLEDYLKRPWSIINIGDGGFVYEVGLLVAAAIGAFHAWRRPPVRAPLGVALVAGTLTWGVTAGAVTAMRGSQPPLPPSQLLSLEGGGVSLTDYQGKPLVVNLWATWCPPCRREMPVLADAQQREPGITFAFVNQGEDQATVEQYLHQEQLQLDNLLLDIHSSTLRSLGASGLPTTFFYNASGELVDTHFGELSAATLKQSLKQLH